MRCSRLELPSRIRLCLSVSLPLSLSLPPSVFSDVLPNVAGRIPLLVGLQARRPLILHTPSGELCILSNIVMEILAARGIHPPIIGPKKTLIEGTCHVETKEREKDEERREQRRIASDMWLNRNGAIKLFISRVYCAPHRYVQV